MKKIISVLIGIFLLIGIYSFWSITREGYDRQNKIILFIKKIVPTKIARDLRDTLFFSSNLKKKNEFLNLQVQKYEQGLEGNVFEKSKIQSTKKINFEVEKFFLPFPRLDVDLGWSATENSTRAHYLEIIKDKILVLSVVGQTIYFEKKNINSEKLNQINIPNNIRSLLKQKKKEFYGVRDLFIEDNYVYISLKYKENDRFTIDIYRAELNFKNLRFKQFFKSNSYWSTYSVSSGGRIETFKDNKIIFSIGFSGVKNASQDKNNLLGKIISIDKTTADYEILSLGHRNPQGLFYEKTYDLIINSEHGPKGGDEINLNFLDKKGIANYGWDVASYGIAYSGEDIYKKAHKEHGFIEPFKFYTPSIGISEILNIRKKNMYNRTPNTIYAASLRAGSIYIIETDKKFTKILNEDRLFFKEQRIRDLEFDEELNVFFVLFEYTPSIAVIKKIN